jgi:hypothetical protein
MVQRPRHLGGVGVDHRPAGHCRYPARPANDSNDRVSVVDGMDGSRGRVPYSRPAG